MDGDSGTPERVFGRRVRQERERRGWRQQDLAARVAGQGVSVHLSTYGKIEAGTRSVRLGEAVAIAAALGLLLSQLLTEADGDELARELDDTRREIAQALERSHEAADRAATLRNRERELLAALAGAGEARDGSR